MYILAMDLGKSKTVSCVFDTKDASHSFVTAPTTPERIRELLLRTKPDRVVFEVCTDAGWIADICRELGVEFQAVNPSTLVHAMHHRRAKTDRRDSHDLAKASALGGVRCVHIPSKADREWRALIEHRSKAVERQTERRNQLRSMFQLNGIAIPGGKRAWTLAGLLALEESSHRMSAADRKRFEIAMEGLRHEEREISALEDLLDEIAAKRSEVALLRTVPGVGARLAETVAAWIDDPHRFRNAKEVGCYAGLTPRPNQSGATDRSARISKAGPSRLRSMLTEVAWIALRWNAWAREVFERASRGSKSRRKQAIVAVARRLFVRLWAMLRDGTPWDPGHAKRVAQSFAH
jgi:transposase